MNPKTPEEDKGGDTFPRPDPTRLTTEQLNSAIEAVKELVFARFEATDKTIENVNQAVLARPVETEKMVDHLRGFIETRLNGMDRAIQLLQAIYDRIPDQTTEKIGALQKLHEEKFASIQTQFRERDVRSEQSSKDSKVAVDAALQAAKEAVGEQNKSSALAIAKSEASTLKQIDQQGSLLATTAKGFDDKISDIKERMDRMEGSGTGKASSTMNMFSTISVVVAVISLLIAAAVLMKHW